MEKKIIEKDEKNDPKKSRKRGSASERVKDEGRGRTYNESTPFIQHRAPSDCLPISVCVLTEEMCGGRQATWESKNPCRMLMKSFCMDISSGSKRASA